MVCHHFARAAKRGGIHLEQDGAPRPYRSIRRAALGDGCAARRRRRTHVGGVAATGCGRADAASRQTFPRPSCCQPRRRCAPRPLRRRPRLAILKLSFSRPHPVITMSPKDQIAARKVQQKPPRALKSPPELTCINVGGHGSCGASSWAYECKSGTRA